MKVRLLSNHS